MKKLILALLLFSASASSQAAATVIGNWPLASSGIDTSGNGYTLTTVGSGLAYGTTGGVPSVSGFSNTSYLKLPAGALTAFGAAHTAFQIDVDVYVTSLPASKAWAGWTGTGAGCLGANFVGFFGSSVIGYESSAGAACLDLTGGAFSTSAWHTVSVVFDGTNAPVYIKSIYVDGTLTNTAVQNADFGATVSVFDIGQAIDTANGNAPWSGSLANFRIWNGAYCSGASCSSPTPTFTTTPTWTPTASPTWTPTATPTASPTKTQTITASPTATPTASPTASPVASPTVTPTATRTPRATASPTCVFTRTPTPRTRRTATTATPTLSPTPRQAKTAGPCCN